MPDPDDVIEGEITETAPATQTSSDIIINMESIIKSHMSSVDKLQEEHKKFKEMLDDIFGNEPVYQEHLEASKEANKIKNNTKKEILKRPEVAELDTKVKSIKSQIKETQAALSDYLQEYARLSGVNEIEGEDGEVREIVYVAKLVKRSFR